MVDPTRGRWGYSQVFSWVARINRFLRDRGAPMEIHLFVPRPALTTESVVQISSRRLWLYSRLVCDFGWAQSVRFVSALCDELIMILLLLNPR